MWIILLKSILALVSIFTGGAIFYKYIKDNKILVFLAGSVSILSAVYLFNEVRRDIDKLVVEKKVEAKVESKKEAVVEGEDEPESNSASSQEPLDLDKLLGGSSSNGKWITPSDSVCKSNGGKVDSDGCVANWENAKKICSASGGSLPSRDDLKKVVVNCGGSFTTYGDKDWDSLIDKNRDNKSYQSCYKKKGFTFSNYWSSTTYAGHTRNAWGVGFYYGRTYGYYKSINSYVRCVRAGQ